MAREALQRAPVPDRKQERPLARTDLPVLEGAEAPAACSLRIGPERGYGLSERVGIEQPERTGPATPALTV